MSVYVDRYEPVTAHRLQFTAHMIADTPVELHMMAMAIGLRSEWVQDQGKDSEHYDLTERRRARAVELGAIEVTSRDLVRIIQRKRLKEQT